MIRPYLPIHTYLFDAHLLTNTYSHVLAHTYTLCSECACYPRGHAHNRRHAGRRHNICKPHGYKHYRHEKVGMSHEHNSQEKVSMSKNQLNWDFLACS